MIIRMKIPFVTAAMLGCILICAPLLAQEPVTPAADAEALFHSKDKKLDANKQVVFHIERDLLEAGHWELADHYLSERYLQHNPNVASGRATVTRFFGNSPSRPIPEKMKTKIVSVTAEGDLVVVALVREYKDPKDPAKMYTTTWFDMWRIQDGKADEHWDCAMKG